MVKVKRVLDNPLFAPLLVASVWAASPALALPSDTLQKTIECSEHNRSLAASFTLTLTSLGTDLVSERYNVETDEWTPIKGLSEKAPKDVQAGFREMAGKIGKRGGLVPEDIFTTLTELALVEETGDRLVYSFVPGAKESEDPMPPAMIAALKARFIVDRRTMCMTGLTMQALKPFKPAPIATIDHFEVVYEFSQPDDSPIPLITAFKTTTKGRALFKKFGQATVMTISDIVIIP